MKNIFTTKKIDTIILIIIPVLIFCLVSLLILGLYEKHLDILLQDTLSYLLIYKYAALFLITFLAAFALPLPSTTSLMTAAVFASQGYLSIGWVIFWAVMGNILADNLAYFIARLYGAAIFEKIGFKVAKSPFFHMVTKQLQNHSRLVIFLSRFEVIMTITVNILIGIARFDYKKFFVYVLLGETSQVIFFALLGYFFGTQFQETIAFFGETAAVIVTTMIFTLFLFRKHII